MSKVKKRYSADIPTGKSTAKMYANGNTRNCGMACGFVRRLTSKKNKKIIIQQMSQWMLMITTQNIKKLFPFVKTHLSHVTVMPETGKA